MKKFKIVTLAAVAVLGLGALGGAAVRANATTSPAPDTASAVTTAFEAPEAASATDADDVQLQEGDQTTADTAADPAGEAAGEQPGSEIPGNDGPGGHADPAGDVNHEFNGVE